MHTEHPFTLPMGLVTPDGRVHREGAMRLALAADEILLLEDPRVKANRAYLVILLLSRVVSRLGDLRGDEITPSVIEALFAADLAYLQDFYRRLNLLDGSKEITCPHCGKGFSSPA